MENNKWMIKCWKEKKDYIPAFWNSFATLGRPTNFTSRPILTRAKVIAPAPAPGRNMVDEMTRDRCRWTGWSGWIKFQKWRGLPACIPELNWWWFMPAYAEKKRQRASGCGRERETWWGLLISPGLDLFWKDWKRFVKMSWIFEN